MTPSLFIAHSGVPWVLCKIKEPVTVSKNSWLVPEEINPQERSVKVFSCIKSLLFAIYEPISSW